MSWNSATDLSAPCVVHKVRFLVCSFPLFYLPILLGWPKSSLVFFRRMLWKNSNKLFDQPSISIDYQIHTPQNKNEQRLAQLGQSINLLGNNQSLRYFNWWDKKSGLFRHLGLVPIWWVQVGLGPVMTDGRAQNWGVEWAACRGGRPDCQHSMSLSGGLWGPLWHRLQRQGTLRLGRVGCVLRGGRSELISSIQWGEG